MVCIQCAMEALLRNETPKWLDESPWEHTRRVHPDPFVAQERRMELEALLKQRFLAERQRGSA